MYTDLSRAQRQRHDATCSIWTVSAKKTDIRTNLVWRQKKIPDKNENIPRRTSTDLKNLLAVFFHANCENFVIPVATDTSSQSVVFGDKDSKETPD